MIDFFKTLFVAALIASAASAHAIGYDWNSQNIPNSTYDNTYHNTYCNSYSGC